MTELVFGDDPQEQPKAKPQPQTQERVERPEPEQSQHDFRRPRNDQMQQDFQQQPQDAVEAFFGGSQRTQFGGISNKTLHALIDVFESIDTGYDDPNIDPALSRKNFRIHPIDANNTNPTLVVGLPTNIGGEEFVIYFSLVLEIPGIQMREVRRHRRDEPMHLPVFSEDRMDSRWRAAVGAAVSRIGTGDHSEAGWQLIPANLLTEDVNESNIREDILAIYTNAVDAICGWREMMMEQAGIGKGVIALSPAFVGDSRYFETSLDYSRKPKATSSKLPIRSDIALTVFHTEAPRGQDGDNLVPTRRPIGTISVAVDMFVTSDQEVSGWGRRRVTEGEPEPFWQPVVNITDIVGEQNIPWSLENSLFMIGSTSLLSMDFRWVEGIRARVGGQYKPMEELGVLTLAHPDPARRGFAEDITPHTLDSELSEFLNYTVKPEVYYGMVLSRGSEKGWANSIFERIALATDAKVRGQLINVLYNAADKLTDGEYSAALHEMGISPNIAPVFTTHNRVFTGYFTDTDGNLRDIREWNVPAIMTFSKAQPQEAYEIGMEYQDTLMNDMSTELTIDLADRYRILETLMGTNSFHLNGTAEMVQLESWFVQALATAMHRCGIMPRMNDHNGLRTRVHRSSSYRGDAIGELDLGGRRRDGDEFSRRRNRR